MAKYLKKYNPKTKEWEVVSAPKDATVIQVISGDTPITDLNVIVTNYNYSNESGNTTLDDTLTVISDDISKLQRNVSWLSEHGGGGGGGGGGGSTSYGIVITSPILENNAYYTTSSSLTITFMITGGTSVDTFQYRYILDGVYTSNYVGVGSDEFVNIKIDNLNMASTASTHTISIEAINPYGNPMVPVSFKVYESSLSLVLDTTKNTIKNGEVLVQKNLPYGNVYFKLKNGVLNSQTSLIGEFNGQKTSISYINESSSEQSITLDVWKLLGTSVKTGDIYTITAYATSILEGVINTKTTVITIPIRITSSDEMLIYFDGLTYYDDVESAIVEPTEFEQNGRIRFTFNVNLPSNVTNSTIYYAIKLYEPGDTEGEIIEGTSFNDANYANNVINVAKQDITVQHPLTSSLISPGWRIDVKAWTYNGQVSAMTSGEFTIIASNNDFYPRQHAKRNPYDASSADTCLFAWHASSKMNESWESKITNYVPVGAMSETSRIAYINLYNTDGKNSGFIKTGDIPYLRLQNESYAIADMSEYISDIKYMTNSNYSDLGFTISVTLLSDENADKEKVAFLWGQNDVNGDLINGCKIKGETATWYLHGEKGKSDIITAYLRQGIKNTVDFVYKNGVAYIYVNGIFNAASSIGKFDESDDYAFNGYAYFACDKLTTGVSRFSDINVYEFAVYTQALSPLQAVVNGKNARINSRSEEEVQKYNEWKKSNLIYNTQENTEKALSYLINSEGEFDYDYQSFQTMCEYSPIPIITINANGSNFTEDLFHQDYSSDKSITKRKFNCTITYYDPETKKSITFSGQISIQGTSTLGYYIKNLEIYVNEVTSYDATKKKLFQPKDTWFPESEFTLKADVVDSSHANNATIGGWINSCGIMSDNPAMTNFTDSTRPIDKVQAGEASYTHTDSRDTSKQINYDEKVTIKHNLEGFPVIVLIQFDGQTTPKLIGQYSFNLGRYSYYNMGMSFLKAFSRRDVSNPKIEVQCPALVDYYEEYSRNETFGDIKLNEIFTYEFGASADDNNLAHQTWTQSDITILKHYGDFNFNGANDDPSTPVGDGDSIWNGLASLFEMTANMGSSDMSNRGFEGKQKYFYDGTKFVLKEGANPYDASELEMSILDDKLSVSNGVAYFITATAFGMIDSLGKNLTLRTWDGGKKWWTCFYDMDSALGLSNEGAESISETAFIDKFYNETSDTAPDIFTTVYHDSNSQYNAFYSKLWAIFRDERFLYNNGLQGRSYYNEKWSEIRQNNKQLSSFSVFTDLMESQIGKCGELIYDYDYNSKYLTGQNLSMLHGLRIEYVRSWLRNRTYFLDGVFEDVNATAADFVDSPFYLDSVNISNRGNMGNEGYIQYTVRSTASMFMRINTGADSIENSNKFYIPSNQDVVIKTKEHTSTKQTNYSSSSLLTKLDGLNNIQVVSLSTNVSSGKNLCSLSNFNIAGTKYLQSNPLPMKEIFMAKGSKSSLEELNLSNTDFGADTTDKNFKLELTDFNKLKRINISNSPVTSLVLPSSALQSLFIYNSAIDNFTMSNQPLLTTVNFNGCNKLQKIDIVNCKGLKTLNIGDEENGLSILSTIKIENCENLEEVNIVNNTSLTSVIISNNTKLKKISIRDCNNTALKIEINGESPLESIILENIESPNIITLPKVEALSGVTSLKMVNIYHFNGIKYYGSDIEMYKGSPVLDISVFTNLDYKNVTMEYIRGLRYLRVHNNEASPFVIEGSKLQYCDDLTRIFGHIEFRANDTIKYCKDFHINEIDNDIVPGKEAPFVGGNPYYTNVTITTKDLSYFFIDTSCNISDVYYILGKCKNVNKLTGAFSNCHNVFAGEETSSNKIERDNLSPNTFKMCTNVIDIDGLFSFTRIKGELSSELLLPLTKDSSNYGGIKTFKDVFANCLITIPKNKSLFDEKNLITEIKEFNPVNTDSVKASELLRSLKELKIITNSFNELSIYFDTNNLLSNNNKLEKVINSFRMIDIARELASSFTNVFGATKLKVISNSFSFCGDGNYGHQAEMLIGNSFLQSISGSIEYIIGKYNKKPNENITSTNSMFFTENRDKDRTDIGIVKHINYNDCDGEKFPYKVFKNCHNLVEITGFFNDLETDDNTVINLPDKGMFDDCTKLENLSYCFSNMKLKYRLMPDGFAKCNLYNVANIFNDFRNLGDNYGKQGTIPYHLFYQEKGNLINNMSGCLANANSSNFSAYTCSDEVFNTYLYEPSTDSSCVYKWNIYIYDGSTDFYINFNNKLSEIITESGLTEVTKYRYYDEDENVYYVDSQSEVPEGVTFEAVKWYIKDGEVIFKEIPEQFKKGYTTIENIGILTYDNVGYNNNGNLYEQAISPKYFCAPDLFKYCNNNSNLNIDGIFSNSSSYSSLIDNGNIFGFRGTIPPFLFWELTNITHINSVFYECRNLYPYKWGYKTTDDVVVGYTYPKDLFKGLKSLQSISNLFGYTTIWGSCQIPDMFNRVGNTLLDVSGLWTSCKWLGNMGEEYQLPYNLFSSCKYITSISNMFYNSNVVMSQNLFTYANNSNIVDCSMFMSKCGNAKGSLPTLWQNWKMMNVRQCYYSLTYDSNHIISPSDESQIPEQFTRI